MADVMQVEHNVRVIQEAQTLAENGYKVDIVGFSNFEKRFAKRTISGIRCYSFYLSNERRGFGKLRRYWSAYKMIIGINLFILLRTYDIYHAHNFHSLIFSLISAKIKGKKLIYDSHESWTVHRQKKYHLEHIFAYIIEKLSMPFIDGFISVNEMVVDYYEKLYRSNNNTVLYNTRKLIPLKMSKTIHNELNINPEKDVVLFQGGFYDKMRGIFELIDAAGLISDNCIVVFIGFGPEPTINAMKEKIKGKKLEGKVFILPPKDPDKLMNYTISADIGMNLIKKAGRAQDFQSPWKLFEFCMAGLAVISTDLPFHKKVHEKHNIGFLIGGENDPKEIADRVNWLISDRKMLDNYKKNARQAAENEFCWEKQEQKLIQKYKKLLS
jgi:glycosyltransferase involved in cell wall biosynthesis